MNEAGNNSHMYKIPFALHNKLVVAMWFKVGTLEKVQDSNHCLLLACTNMLHVACTNKHAHHSAPTTT